jgi:hypothetical protein
MPKLSYPTGQKLWLCPGELAMDMAVNTPGSKKLEIIQVQFLEPVDENCSKIINDNGRIEVVSNGRLSTWK